jgi:hypothetical protein
MNAEIKKQWIEALKSGDYKQTTAVLKSTSDGVTTRYCCLGVLCDIYAKETKTQWDERNPNDYSMLGNSSTLPFEVLRWSGLENAGSCGDLPDGDSLVALNDRGQSFNQIADVIQEKL